MTSPVHSYTQGKFDTAQLQPPFIIPVVPPTLIGACIEDEKGNQSLEIEFPLTIATLPFLKAAMPQPKLDYDACCTHVEGGRYISPQFRILNNGGNLGLKVFSFIEQSVDDQKVLYRPLYVRISQQQLDLNNLNICAQDFSNRESTSLVSRSIPNITTSKSEKCLTEESFHKTNYRKPGLSTVYSTRSLY
uniref:Uncharacterized protein n=1 Tax=Setaria digitata TaxID=48799 RepID=A0A915PGK0_9BILA